MTAAGYTALIFLAGCIVGCCVMAFTLILVSASRSGSED